MTVTIQPTRAARRVHLSHLATTHRAPLVPRPADAAPGADAAGRATSFTPMSRDPFARKASPEPSRHES